MLGCRRSYSMQSKRQYAKLSHKSRAGRRLKDLQRSTPPVYACRCMDLDTRTAPTCRAEDAAEPSPKKGAYPVMYMMPPHRHSASQKSQPSPRVHHHSLRPEARATRRRRLRGALILRWRMTRKLRRAVGQCAPVKLDSSHHEREATSPGGARIVVT